MGLIYKATCTVTGRSYIGQTSRQLTNRQKEHQQQAKSCAKRYSLLHKAIRKYGAKYIQWEVVEECADLDLDVRERYHIQDQKTHVSQGGYNLTWGGDKHFGASGEHHWLTRRTDREQWIQQYRCGSANPNYQNGDAIAGSKHFLNRMKPRDKEAWLDEHLRADNNYQKHLTAQERKDRHWIHSKTPEELEAFKAKMSGANNPFARKMKEDPQFREQMLKRGCRPPKQEKQWKITTPENETVIITGLSQFIRQHYPDWNMNGVRSAIHNQRPYRGYQIELMPL